MWAPTSSAVLRLPTLSANDSLDVLRAPTPARPLMARLWPSWWLWAPGTARSRISSGGQGGTAGRATRVVATASDSLRLGREAWALRVQVALGWLCPTCAGHCQSQLPLVSVPSLRVGPQQGWGSWSPHCPYCEVRQGAGTWVSRPHAFSPLLSRLRNGLPSSW